MLRDVASRELLERKLTFLFVVVVTRKAVLLNQGLVRGGSDGTTRRCLLGIQRQREAGSGDESRDAERPREGYAPSHLAGSYASKPG
jgi:hypothetical protein